ncbi:uncharacterized protein [Physcomitrium patens]|uniref:Uncharacterized protein n=1 Tax=Physcomitrium patens TaxID=3218 RepID=A0A2K1KM77_PHYPA|nr:uncharacterized protein LOC112281437 [Physcomitrium patens]PNR54888.1 hypothetical protein PHYPA_005781 [Physcomitrium patens]|eukprot:XP_024373719.1 uncharacterized protein LOC112281437 [Physcomitrella patens]
MKTTLKSKLQVFIQRIVSSSVYCLVSMWLVRTIVFTLLIGKCILIWLLRLSFSLVREFSRLYPSVELFNLTVASPLLTRATKQSIEKMEILIRSSKCDEAEGLTTSPLLPIVLKDRVRVSEENREMEDRERLLYEFDKIVAPQVSAFQLGEIVVPSDDTRQLAMFLKSKLSETCNSLSSVNISDAICGPICNIRTEETISHCVDSWEGCNNITYALVYIVARLQCDNKVHLVLAGRKVEHFLGSSEYRNRFNPPHTRFDKREWQSWTLAFFGSLRESAISSALELLARDPVHAQVW